MKLVILLQTGVCYFSSIHTQKDSEDMACKISKFPQTAVLANRRSIIESRGLSVGNGIKLDLRSEVDTSYEEVAKGTTRFDAGVGHHGVFKII